jgi:transmembrane sensor
MASEGNWRSMTTPEKMAKVKEAARHWVVYLHSGHTEPEQLAKLEAWMASNPDHAEAFREFEQLFQDLTHPGWIEDEKLLPVPPPSARSTFPKWLQAAALVLVVGFLGVGFAVFSTSDVPSPTETVFQTAIAELREVHLEDGSIITVGARSRLETHFTDAFRIVSLPEGQAFFNIAPDSSRPFYVEVGTMMVRVVGTKFDIKNDDGTMRIAVADGIVSVMKADAPSTIERALQNVDKSVLRAGDQLLVSSSEPTPEKSTIEPEKTSPWREGWLSYENASLSEIVSDLNRYRDASIVLADPALGDLRITAAFGVDQTDQFIAVLHSTHDISRRDGPNGQVILTHDGA